MSATPQEIRGFFDEAERLAAQLRAIREAFAAMRKRALKKQIDWTQLKALAVAHDADKHDDKNSRHVAKLVAKAEYANWYAEILDLSKHEQVSHACSSSLTPNDAGTVPRHVAEPAPSIRTPAIPGAGSSSSNPPSGGSEPARVGVSTRKGEIEPVSDPGFSAGSRPSLDSAAPTLATSLAANGGGTLAGEPKAAPGPFIPEPDPRDDIINQPFYRGGQSWPR